MHGSFQSWQPVLLLHGVLGGSYPAANMSLDVAALKQ
jgi:hypothetical protein